MYNGKIKKKLTRKWCCVVARHFMRIEWHFWIWVIGGLIIIKVLFVVNMKSDCLVEMMVCQGFPIFVWPNPLINRQRLTESVKFDLTARYCWILLGWRLRYIAILFEVLNYFLRFRAFRFPIYLLIVRHENNQRLVRVLSSKALTVRK